MNSIEEALNTLISAVNIAQKKGVYSLEESHYVYMAIAYINSLAQQQPETTPAAAAAEQKFEEESVDNMPHEMPPSQM